MPYPKQYLLWSGQFGVAGTDELAETTLKISTLGGAPFDAAAVLATWSPNDVGTILAYLTAAMNGPPDVSWAEYSLAQSAKLAAMDVTGHYLTDPVIYTDATPATGSDPDVPAQCSIVASLRSGLTLGVANYGRMYLPHTLFQTAAGSPYAGGTGPLDLAQSMASFIAQTNALAATKAAGSGAVLLSNKGSGVVRGIANVAVGNVTDTQRRRREQLNETYETQAI